MLNPVAERDFPDSCKLIEPEEAYQLRTQEKFYCPDHDCKDSDRLLIAAKSSRGNYFFKHKPDCNHDISPETLLHKLAIKYFENRREFQVPEFEKSNAYSQEKTLRLNPDHTQLEYRRLQRIIPDVRLKTDKNFEFAIEIVVTSDIDEEKKKLIEKFNLPTLRIDLSRFYRANQMQCKTDIEFINNHLDDLLSDLSKKSWVIPPKVETKRTKGLEVMQKNRKYSFGVPQIAFLILLFLVFMISFRQLRFLILERV